MPVPPADLNEVSGGRSGAYSRFYVGNLTTSFVRAIDATALTHVSGGADPERAGWQLLFGAANEQDDCVYVPKDRARCSVGHSYR